MSFPDLDDACWLTPLRRFGPGPYEEQMGRQIAHILRFFSPLVADVASNALVLSLVERSDRWAAGHAVFDAIRDRTRGRSGVTGNAPQYWFEETCAQAVYNAVACDASAWSERFLPPFDPSAPFYVIPAAFALAKHLGIEESAVAANLLIMG
jgi:hypothetical protein